MEISLRSQMAAGVALAGAAAIAVTPITSPQLVPSLERVAANVSLSALDNPFTALLGSLAVGTSYILSAGDATDETNWIGSGIDSTIATFVLPELAVGIIPDFLLEPIPVALQLLSNQLGYLGIGVEVGGAVLGALGELAWLPVSLVQTIIMEIVAGTPENIPDEIAAAVNDALAIINGAFTLAVDGVTEIVTSIIARGTAVANVVLGSAQQLLAVAVGTFNVGVATITSVFNNIAAGFAGSGFEGAFNAAVTGLLAPEGDGVNYVGLTLPGALLNMTIGAGVQIDPTDSDTFVPSVRTVVEFFEDDLAGALAVTPVLAQPAAAAASELSASDVQAEVAADASSVESAAPAAGDSTPAASDNDGDDSTAKKSSHRQSRKAS